MPRKKGKTVSFDAMVKFFMQNYDIPTKKDVEGLTARLDRIEKLLKSLSGAGAGSRAAAKPNAKPPRGGSGMTALDQVLEVIKDYQQGAGIAEIKMRTGFDDKKIRNIIYRLNKDGKIDRISRGMYIALNA